MKRHDSRRRWDCRLRRVFADQDDVAVANSIDTPIELVFGTVAAPEVHDLRTADEGPFVDDSPFSGRVYEHGAGPVGAQDDRDEFELVDRVLGQLDLSLVERLFRHRLALHEKASKGITIVIALDKVVLRILRPLELRRESGSDSGRDGRYAARGRLRRGAGRIAARHPEGQRGQEGEDSSRCRLHFATSPRGDSLGAIAWKAVARQRPLRTISSPTSVGS